jgi:hypothetical protein
MAHPMAHMVLLILMLWICPVCSTTNQVLQRVHSTMACALSQTNQLSSAVAVFLDALWRGKAGC